MRIPVKLNTESKRHIDLLAVDKNVNLVVIEQKRTTDGGHMRLTRTVSDARPENGKYRIALKSELKFNENESHVQ